MLLYFRHLFSLSFLSTPFAVETHPAAVDFVAVDFVAVVSELPLAAVAIELPVSAVQPVDEAVAVIKVSFPTTR